MDLRDLGITASGGIGHEWVYQKNGYRRTWVKPDNPQTEEQQTWRYKFKDVLAELMIAGAEFRQLLNDKLGPRWHARIIGRCLASEALYFQARLQEFASFDEDDREAWASYDDLGELTNEHGAVFFLVACAVWDELHAKGIEPGYTSPSASNSVQVAAVWPREVGDMFLTRAQADALYALLAHLHDDRYLQSVPQQDHGGLSGLADDDHSQYYDQTRGDARYLRSVPQQDHGGLAGLGDDDHSQYHNDTRGDARYSVLAHTHAFDVAFAAYQTNAQAIASGGANKVLIFETETKDTGGYYSTSTGRFTPAVAGTYLINAFARLNSLAASKEWWVGIGKNGGGTVLFWGSPQITSAIESPAASCVEKIYMNGTTDYLEVLCWHNHGSDRNTTPGLTYCRFSAVRISSVDLVGW